MLLGSAVEPTSQRSVALGCRAARLPTRKSLAQHRSAMGPAQDTRSQESDRTCSLVRNPRSLISRNAPMPTPSIPPANIATIQTCNVLADQS